MVVAGIGYQSPKVHLLQESGIGVAEIAARTCYDSFDKSENACIQDIGGGFLEGCTVDYELAEHLDNVNNIEHSDLLNTLAWTHFHHSILEHATLSYLVKGTSRGVLQEHARHRIQAISVRSTRYTMSGILNAFVSLHKEDFISYILSLDMFIVKGEAAKLEAEQLNTKLRLQKSKMTGIEFTELIIAKSSLHWFETCTSTELFNKLQAGKKKRNVGDAFKWVVTDNWKVDMIVTFNLRSLKNYFQLRDSGAAYFQIQALARAMKAITPKKINTNPRSSNI